MNEPKTQDEIGQWVIEYQGRISTEADALVMLRGIVTSRTIRRLIRQLESMFERYPEVVTAEALTPDGQCHNMKQGLGESNPCAHAASSHPKAISPTA